MTGQGPGMLSLLSQVPSKQFKTDLTVLNKE